MFFKRAMRAIAFGIDAMRFEWRDGQQRAARREALIKKAKDDIKAALNQLNPGPRKLVVEFIAKQELKGRNTDTSGADEFIEALWAIDAPHQCTLVQLAVRYNSHLVSHPAVMKWSALPTTRKVMVDRLNEAFEDQD